MLGAALARRPARLNFRKTINGTIVRARLVKRAGRADKVVGFVHNPDVDVEELFTAR